MSDALEPTETNPLESQRFQVLPHIYETLSGYLFYKGHYLVFSVPLTVAA